MDSAPDNMLRKAMDEPVEPPDVHLTWRTKVCIWVIVLGLANFLVYSVVYFLLPGEAIHGGIRSEPVSGGQTLHYFLVDDVDRKEVSRGVWLYSAAHSASIPFTVGAVLLAMLTVAKDRILSSMRSSAVRGRLFITLLALVVGVISVMWMIWFLRAIIVQLRDPAAM